MEASLAEITPADVEWLRQRSQEADAPSFSRVAREFGQHKGFIDACGRPRDVAVRVLLNRAQVAGMVELPPRRAAVPKPTRPKETAFPDGVFRGEAKSLADLGPIEIVAVTRANKQEHRQWKGLLDAGHYLGSGPLCGAQLRYLVRCPLGLLGALAFSSSAWQLDPREKVIGWSHAARRQNHHLVVCNSRFLVVADVPNLASHVLASCLDRLPLDWKQTYGYPPLLVETFVDPSRFKGTCYLAAGWTCIGVTSGRGRQDRDRKDELCPKLVFLKSLDERAYEKLKVEPVKPPPHPGEPWEITEFGGASFNDRRLLNRLFEVARDFYAHPSSNIPQAAGSASKARATYRFFANPEVPMESILEPHFEASLSRAAQEGVVLAVQDTTSLNYTTHRAAEGLGPIGNKSSTPTLGLHLHCTLLVNTKGTPLGLLDVQCWARDPKDHGKSLERHDLPIEDKESQKWIDSYRATAKAQERVPTTRFVSVGDREADIYELFLEAKKTKEGPDYLIRATHKDRCLIVEKGEEHHRQKHLESLPCSGTLPLEVPRRAGRPAREATLELRFAKVLLKPPSDKRQFKEPISVWALLAQESKWPPDQERIEWLLLTTMPVTTVEECAEKLEWYTLRWQIEVFHKTIKSGCRIEDRQLGSADSLKKCIAIDLVVGYRIFSLAKMGREIPDAPCTVYFEENQWKALTCFLNKQPCVPKNTPTPSLRATIRMLARLGGFLARKSDGEPGTEALWRGLQRLDDITETFVVCWAAMPDTS